MSSLNALDIRHELAHQDNDCTSDPIFLVEKEVIDWGFDAEYAEEFGWFDVYGSEPFSEDHWPLFEAAHEADEDEVTINEDEVYPLSEDVERVGIRRRWEFVQPFLTRKAAEGFIQAHGHKYGKCRVMVDSAYRNEEWQGLREHFLAMR